MNIRFLKNLGPENLIHSLNHPSCFFLGASEAEPTFPHLIFAAPACTIGSIKSLRLCRVTDRVILGYFIDQTDFRIFTFLITVGVEEVISDLSLLPTE